MLFYLKASYLVTDRPLFLLYQKASLFKLFTSADPNAESKGNGLKVLTESIDNRTDFKTYMQNYAYARGGAPRGPRREGPAEEGFVRASFSFI